MFQRALKLVVALTLPLAVTSAVLADPLVHLLFGSQFVSAAPALQLLAPTMALFPIGHLAGLFLIARHEVTPVAVTYGVLTVANMVLNVLFIPRFSLFGAAAITSLSQAVLTTALVVLSQRALDRLSFRRILSGPIFACAGAVGAMLLFHDQLVWALMLGGLVYVTALASFERIVFPQDLQSLATALRRGGI